MTKKPNQDNWVPIEKGGRNPPPPTNYTKPAPTPAPPPPTRNDTKD